MAIESISFSSPRPKDRTGNPVSEGCAIPQFRGGKYSDKEIIKKLDTALEYLSESDCSFWACEGPTRPKDMCTCGKCRAMREVAIVKAAILRRTHRMPLFERN